MRTPSPLLAAVGAIALVAAACSGSSATTTTTAPVGLTVTAGAPVPLLPADGEEASSVVLTFDGEFVVYAVRRGANWALVAAPTQLGPLVTLHEGLSEVGAIEVAADSQSVVYLATVDDGPPQLYAARLDGGAPTLLWDDTIRLAGFDAFAVTPDSQQVVFRAGTEQGEALLAVPLTGGDALVLAEVTDAGHAGLGVDGPGFMVTDDSRHVVFLASSDGLVSSLFVVPLAGGEPQAVSPTPPGDSGVLSFEITPDGSRVVYLGNLRVADVTELFSAPLDPVGPPVRINDDLPEFGNVVAWSIDDAGEQAVFIVGQDADTGAGLFTAPVAGGPDVLLAARPSGADPSALVVGRFAIAPDGSRVAAELFGAEGQWVVSTPIEGGEVIQLHPDGFVGRLVDFTADSQRVLFVLDDALASAPAAGGEARQITARVPVLQVRDTSQEGIVLLTAGQAADMQGVYVVAPQGGDVVTVAEPRSGSASITGALLVPDRERVVFVEGGAGALTGIYIVPLVP